MRFAVTGYDASGNTIRRTVEAGDPDEAKQRSGIPLSRIASVKQDALGSLLDGFSRKRPKQEVQAVFMGSLGAILLSGQSIERGIDKLLTQYKGRIKYDPERVRQTTKASELLEALNFDPVAVSLVQVGEKTGSVAASLSKAASSIIYQLKLKEELGRELLKAWVYLAIGGTLMSVIVLGFGPILKEIMSEPGLVLPATAGTHFIMDSHSFLVATWPFQAATLVLVLWQRRRLWLAVRGFPVLSWIWNVQRLKHALFFISGFQTLFLAGVTEDKAFRLLEKGAGRGAQKAYSTALTAINEGVPLSRAIDTDEWPDAMRSGMSGFEHAVFETKTEILANLVEVLLLQQRVTGKRVARLAFVLGMGIALAAIGLMIMGAVFPLQQMKAV